MTDRTTTVNIEMTTNYYNRNGELTDAVVSSSKLTKADAGRSSATDEDSLCIKHNGSATSKAEIDYNGSANSTGDDVSMSTEVELNVKGQVKDAASGELIDTIAASSKLTKADAGRMVNEVSETWLNLQVDESMDGNEPKVTARSHSKLTKADAGRA